MSLRFKSLIGAFGLSVAIWGAMIHLFAASENAVDAMATASISDAAAPRN